MTGSGDTPLFTADGSRTIHADGACWTLDNADDVEQLTSADLAGLSRFVYEPCGVCTIEDLGAIP